MIPFLLAEKSIVYLISSIFKLKKEEKTPWKKTPHDIIGIKDNPLQSL